jgi:single-stranded-DNA-specific exonuclease
MISHSGVTRSFTDRIWRERLDEQGKIASMAMVQRSGVSEVLARVLAGRGIAIDGVADYLDPTLKKQMPDPYCLTDMQVAVDRLADAVENSEKIAIFGDYDVDGATSAALLGSFFMAAGVEFRIHIPDRIIEGYGPNSAAIRALAAEGAKLLVTVDCGSTSYEALQVARDCGVDAVVLDHHQVGANLPPAVAVVNPNRQDDVSGLQHLAAVGVVFMTLVALNRILRQRGFWSSARPAPDLLSHLDLVALGTVADVVPLKGLNRSFVSKGLMVMGQRQRPGLRALADIARMDGPPSPYHLGFLLGPRINAGGRIGQADLGCRLLLTPDDIQASQWAQELERLNVERQLIERQTLDEAEAGVNVADDAPLVTAHGQGWHPGVVGLVAARLKERYRRPAFAIAFDETTGLGTGSGRSIAGVDLGAAVREAVDAGLLVKGGGHAMAAGITLERARMEAFELFMADRLGDNVAVARTQDGLFLDGFISAAGIRPQVIADIAQAGPFGSGNPEPLFMLPSHRLVSADPVGGSHVRVRLQAGDGSSLRGIAFRAVGQKLGDALFNARGQVIHVAANLHIDRWGGGERAEVRLVDGAYPQS